jgi:hypothetical protein
MTPLTIALTLLWLAAAFAAVRYFGRRYFHETGRAEAVAGAVVIAAIAGMALDPFRTAGVAAPAAAPQASTSGDVPAIAALFGTEFAAWQSGNVSPANYTPSGFAASRTLLKRFIPILRALGPVRRERFVATSAQNGIVSYEYRFDCANGSELMGANLDVSGKIVSLGFATAPAGG